MYLSQLFYSGQDSDFYLLGISLSSVEPQIYPCTQPMYQIFVINYITNFGDIYPSQRANTIQKMIALAFTTHLRDCEFALFYLFV